MTTNVLTSDKFLIERATLTIEGLENTYRFLQMSDSHMSIDSPLDSNEMREKAAKHREIWMTHGNGLTQEENFAALAAFGNEHADCFLLAGDMADFPSVGTADEMTKSFCSLKDYLYAPGNHEMGSEHPDLYAAATNGSPALQVKELGELRLVAVDNAAHSIEDDVMDRLEALLTGDKPVILLHHTPVSCATLRPAAVSYWGDVSYFLFGEKGEGKNIARYNKLLTQQRTRLNAVIAGHLHFYHTDMFDNGVMQFVSAPCLSGYARLLTVKGTGR